MSVLVTGGAGYIGSHTAHALADRGEKVVVLDNLISGVRAFVPETAHFVHGSARDKALVSRIIDKFGVETVIHFAGSIAVPESIERPIDYYENNTMVSCALAAACMETGVDQFIFSSTAAVYGSTEMAQVSESAPTHPVNPYGRSKLMVEWMLEDAAKAHRFRYVALRYFNVAGVEPGGGAGQPERQIPHLIKRVAQVALGGAACLDVYGTDYPTRDGTAVRDYIHILDLVEAHLSAVDYLRGGGTAGVFNCGYGTGASVLEVVAAFGRLLGRELPVRPAPRRDGDPAYVVADPSRISAAMGWQPRFNDLNAIVESALKWEARAAGGRPAQRSK
ncbi:MAG TPA: UDP-glucose 4-epimerase GalE [Rhizomicrobium sp.]|jgi:UDP-glucose 4-epimerase|nr:UDP-glucose 4-epimerase GalE [Rhizomicrobium sp.]